MLHDRLHGVTEASGTAAIFHFSERFIFYFPLIVHFILSSGSFSPLTLHLLARVYFLRSYPHLPPSFSPLHLLLHSSYVIVHEPHISSLADRRVPVSISVYGIHQSYSHNYHFLANISHKKY